MNHGTEPSGYLLGHSRPELERLRRQAAVYTAFTEDVLSSAGLRAGMHVLDVGCGVGDVSFAAARLVGPGGSVRGIDRSAAALEVGRARAEADRLQLVRFDLADIDDADDARYDAVIGRFILLHRLDPVATIASLAGRLRPGGVIAFVEMDLSTASVVPPMPLFAETMRWMREVYARDGFHVDMGSALYGSYCAAGLEPQLLGTVRVEGGPDAYAYDYVADTVRSMLPRLKSLGIATADEVGVDTLAARLRSEALAGAHCFFYPRMIGAFARKPR